MFTSLFTWFIKQDLSVKKDSTGSFEIEDCSSTKWLENL